MSTAIVSWPFHISSLDTDNYRSTHHQHVSGNLKRMFVVRGQNSHTQGGQET